MALMIDDPRVPGQRWCLFDVLAGWNKARITAGLQDGSLEWKVECDLAGGVIYLLMTRNSPRRVVATACLNGQERKEAPGGGEIME